MCSVIDLNKPIDILYKITYVLSHLYPVLKYLLGWSNYPTLHIPYPSRKTQISLISFSQAPFCYSPYDIKHSLANSTQRKMIQMVVSWLWHVLDWRLTSCLFVVAGTSSEHYLLTCRSAFMGAPWTHRPITLLRTILRNCSIEGNERVQQLTKDILDLNIQPLADIHHEDFKPMSMSNSWFKSSGMWLYMVETYISTN